MAYSDYESLSPLIPVDLSPSPEEEAAWAERRRQVMAELVEAHPDWDVLQVHDEMVARQVGAYPDEIKTYLAERR